MLKSLKIDNFRCFQSFELQQLGIVNLLVGTNVRIQVWKKGIREGIAKSQEWAEIASRKKVITERD